MTDPMTKGAAIAAAGAGAVGGFIMPGVLDVPLGVVIAGFVGAAAILSWLPTMPVKRMLGTVFFCAAAGIWGASLLVNKAELGAGSGPIAALAIAAVLQLVIPWLIENRSELGKRVLAILSFGRKGGD